MLKCLGGVRCTQEKACGPSRAEGSARGGGTVSECLELHGVCLWRVRRIAWQKESCRAGLLTWIVDFSWEVEREPKMPLAQNWLQSLMEGHALAQILPLIHVTLTDVQVHFI